MHDEADEAGGHQPANEENEVKCGFSPEKPCLPLSIEGSKRDCRKKLLTNLQKPKASRKKENKFLAFYSLASEDAGG